MPRLSKKKVEEQMLKTMTVEELLKSGLVGIWKNRIDIDDNLEFARELRDKSWVSKDLNSDLR
ncbi:MAG: hypothetical protein HQM10_27090 [Candidatus Riflebacteria bacterium]|nr:hypothetical protein [Candidatus Riflebacteria bacterium]